MPVRMIVSPVAAAAADARDQRDVGHQPVHRAEDAGAQPAAGDVAVRVVAMCSANSAERSWVMAAA